MSLSIQTGVRGQHAFVVALRGEVDYASARQVREAVSALLGTGSTIAITIDLGGVTFLDSTGVGTLVVAHRICADCGVRLNIVRPNAFIMRLFQVLGVAETLGVRVPAQRNAAGDALPRSGDPLPQSA